MHSKIGEALVQLKGYRDSNVYVSFSGGKDSLVALDLAVRAGISKVVFCDTTIEFRETLQYIKRIEDFYGINIERVMAPLTFFELVQKIGFPSRKSKWCCEVFKFAPQALFALNNNIDGYITGLRHEESSHRRSYQLVDANPHVPVMQINPLLEWTQEEIWDYIHAENLPINPLYEYFERIGCWLCPNRTSQEWMQITRHFPEYYAELINNLDAYADKLAIADKDAFIKEMKWTCWANPIKKVITGSYSRRNVGHEKETIDIRFSTDEDHQITKVARIIPILTSRYVIKELASHKIMQISTHGMDIQKLNMLIEKAINCQSCGACLALCKSKALKLDEGVLTVDDSRCVQCHDCVSTRILRMSCVIRNFSRKRASLLRLCS
jgi:phosphoadenosine phosphosulfate reductase